MSKMKFAVVVFRGSNCDRDTYLVIRDILGQPVEYVYWDQTSLAGADCVILSGGFADGDYLRAGAIATDSPIMDPIREHARLGKLVLGICNGFQILCQSKLLPGSHLWNDVVRFRCMPTRLRVETTSTPFTRGCSVGDTLSIPIAHNEGRYYVDQATLAKMEENQQIVFRYVDENGEPIPASNPNGSVSNIAAVCNPERNVTGIMPHPERVSEALLCTNSTDGLVIWNSILKEVVKNGAVN